VSLGIIVYDREMKLPCCYNFIQRRQHKRIWKNQK